MASKIWPLLIFSFSAQLAHAQQNPFPPIPEHPAKDENGVDLAGWNMVSYDWSPISIGMPGEGGLSLRYYGFGVGRSNFSADLTLPDNTTSQSVIVATFGEQTTKFQDGVLDTSDPGNGYSFCGSLPCYTLKDGTEIDYFLPNNVYANMGGNGRYALYPSQVKFPSGETWTYHNKIYYPSSPNGYLYASRVQSITSNRGYQVKFEYQSNAINDAFSSWPSWWFYNKVYLINNSFEYCDPDADICNLSLNWPNVVIASSGDASISTQSVTNDQGYQYKFISTSLGDGLYKYQIFTPRSQSETLNYYTEKYQHPDDHLYNPYAMRWRVKNFSRDGNTWNYNYSISTSGVATLNRIAPDTTLRQYHVQMEYTTDYNSGSTKPAKIDWEKNELGNESNFTYDEFTRILTSSKPEGDWLAVTYDDRGNLKQSISHAKPGSNMSNITRSANFPALGYCQYAASCNKPTAVVDALGAQTDYTYDQVHGGVLSEMAPAPTPGVARPLSLTTWVQRYASVKNSTGNLVQATSPVWVKASQTQCQTSAGSSQVVCDSSGPQSVTTYEYGASGTPEALLVKGRAETSGGQTIRTCYAYDRYARRVLETRPNASLGVCP